MKKLYFIFRLTTKGENKVRKNSNICQKGIYKNNYEFKT